jgi:hypothetical protein
VSAVALAHRAAPAIEESLPAAGRFEVPDTVQGAPSPPSRQVDLVGWRAILQTVRAERAPLAAVLEHASPIACGPDRVVLGYEPGSFLAKQATDAPAVEMLTRHVRAYFVAPTAVAFDLTAGPKSSPSVAALDNEERRRRLEQARRAVADHPLVRTAIDILGAQLADVRLPE